MYTFTYIHNISINVNQLIKGTQLSSPFTFSRDREYLAINFTAYCDLTAIKIYTISELILQQDCLNKFI